MWWSYIALCSDMLRSASARQPNTRKTDSTRCRSIEGHLQDESGIMAVFVFFDHNFNLTRFRFQDYLIGPLPIERCIAPLVRWASLVIMHLQTHRIEYCGIHISDGRDLLHSIIDPRGFPEKNSNLILRQDG